MKPSRTAAAHLLPGGALMSAVPSAGAVTPQSGGDRGGWQPYRSSPFVAAAGTQCAFALKGDVVRDEERIRTLAVDAAGKPTEREVTGPLVFRFTNESSGASVVRNLAGTAWLYYHTDGSQTWVVVGHLGMGIKAGNPYQPPGHYVLTGRLILDIHSNGVPQLVAHQGATENLCDTLG
ncbi:hypothetical protein ABIA33_006091 [Streptacidiphilus sp. MAP12-16]|uniref:hypothetical protein n=1 Tax=Streptacidiphilus sp. MAP12-16 TaxID=3156300 RepID=UPI0035138338